MMDEQEFTRRLLDVFRIEAADHRRSLLEALRELENTETDTAHAAAAIEQSLRAAHTLKGAARAVNKSRIAILCQSLESIFSLLKTRQKRLEREMFGILYEAIAGIEKLEAGDGDGDPVLDGRLNEVRAVLERQA
jgi:two-component system, chemotaxis family, sensor kinase CheA